MKYTESPIDMNKDETWVGVRMEEIKRDHMIIFLSQRDNRDDVGHWDNQELELLLNNDPNWKEPNYSELLDSNDGQTRSSAGASKELTPGSANTRYKYVSMLFSSIARLISSTPLGAAPQPNRPPGHPPNRSPECAFQPYPKKAPNRDQANRSKQAPSPWPA